MTVRLATNEDSGFLRDLFFEVRAPEFQVAGLYGEPLNQMLSQQYHAMRTHYDRFYAEAIYEIFESEGKPIGYQATIELDTFHLIDIALTETYRNQGIGTERMKALQAKSKSLQLPLTLTVEKFNPALRLYERLGFKPYADSDMYLRMRWE